MRGFVQTLRKRTRFKEGRRGVTLQSLLLPVRVQLWRPIHWPYLCPMAFGCVSGFGGLFTWILSRGWNHNSRQLCDLTFWYMQGPCSGAERFPSLFSSLFLSSNTFGQVLLWELGLYQLIPSSVARYKQQEEALEEYPCGSDVKPMKEKSIWVWGGGGRGSANWLYKVF